LWRYKVPILRKNWGLARGESLNFSIDYVSDAETLAPISLTNYSARLVISKPSGSVVKTYFDGTGGIWSDPIPGHIGVDVSGDDLASTSESRLDYTVYLDNKYVPSDKDAILRGRIEIT
jgi:hypothetical protein